MYGRSSRRGAQDRNEGGDVELLSRVNCGVWLEIYIGVAGGLQLEPNLGYEGGARG
jgi:hypothetical protein